MKKTEKCPKCGSGNIIKGARVIDKADCNIDTDAEVATYENPNARLFRGKKSTKISAWVCGSCGFIEYYAESPSTLL